MSRQVKVVAVLGHDRERVLLDEPLTIDTLGLIQAASPLSRMFLDGAGMAYRPKSIKVYLDGELCWSQKCLDPGYSTSVKVNTTRPHDAKIVTVPFTDAFPEDWDWDDERLADNRTAAEYLHNDYSAVDWAEDIAAELCESAGSLRPKMQPAKAAPLPSVDAKHAPYPTDYDGRRPCATTPGLPYHKATGIRNDGSFLYLITHIPVKQ